MRSQEAPPDVSAERSVTQQQICEHYWRGAQSSSGVPTRIGGVWVSLARSKPSRRRVNSLWWRAVGVVQQMTRWWEFTAIARRQA
jgi:hypothetical protein